jgi:hypothetical protein
MQNDNREPIDLKELVIRELRSPDSEGDGRVSQGIRRGTPDDGIRQAERAGSLRCRRRQGSKPNSRDSIRDAGHRPRVRRRCARGAIAEYQSTETAASHP